MHGNDNLRLRGPYSRPQDNHRYRSWTQFRSVCPFAGPHAHPSGAQKDGDFDQFGDECDVYGKGPNAGDGDVSFSATGNDVMIK